MSIFLPEKLPVVGQPYRKPRHEFGVGFLVGLLYQKVKAGMSANKETLDDLQMSMRNVRSLIEDDVDEFVESTRKLTDWKTYVRDYPVATTLLAAAVGYTLIPEAKQIVSPDADAIARLAKRNKLVVQVNPEPQKKAGLTGTLFGLASSMLFRGLATYLGNEAGRLAGHKASDPVASSTPTMDQQSF